MLFQSSLNYCHETPVRVAGMDMTWATIRPGQT